MNPKVNFGNKIPQQVTGNCTADFSSAEAVRKGGLKRQYFIFILCYTAFFLLSGCANSVQETVRKELNEGWKFRQSGDTNFINAKVPGLVQLDLLNAGLIEDPFCRSNEDSIQWIAEKDWEYMNEFELDKNFLNKGKTLLVFDGLDTYSQIYLNDSLVLETDNMFRQWKVDVSHILKPENQLLIHFYSPVKKIAEAAEKSKWPLPEQRAFARKAPYQFGWDWGPKIITSGIWKPVYLLQPKETRINSTYFYTDSIVGSTAYLSAEIEIVSGSGKETQLTISNENELLFSKKINLKQENTKEKFQFEVPKAKLWWANGLGEASLYNFKTEITANGKPVDSVNDLVGIRTLKLIEKKDASGKSFYFELNGLPVFMKGANYIPSDNFLTRVDSSKYRSIIKSVKESNMNMLRVWGGGIYENDLFYRLCDENGILVWQDFMFAGTMYPGDDHFIENCQSEAIEQITRLRNHPSIALWCGNNEVDEAWHNWGWQQQFGYSELQQSEIWGAYQSVFQTLFPELVRDYDPSRQYWASSPKIGWGHKESLLEGDSHYWGVWWGNEPFSVFNEKVGRFMSEYGFQAFPAESTLDSVLLPADKYFFSPALKTHEKHMQGFEIINNYMRDEYKIPQSFEDYIYVSQLLQAKGIGEAIEAHRRAKPYCMGTLYWQLNDCWPVISWSGIDYYGNWKALQYTVKKDFDDLMISVEQKEDSILVWAVSDRREKLKTTLNLELLNFAGQILWHDQVNIEIPPNSSQIYYRMCGQNKIRNFKPGEIVFKADFKDIQGKQIDRLHYFSENKKLNLPEPGIRYTCSKIPEGFEIILETNKLAKNLYLLFPGYKGYFTDNYFDLLPGTSKYVKFITTDAIESPENSLKVKSLFSCF